MPPPCKDDAGKQENGVNGRDRKRGRPLHCDGDNQCEKQINAKRQCQKRKWWNAEVKSNRQ